jgi:predicted DNA-binding protein (MmcQ/YjbR family)
MTREELRAWCLEMPGAEETFPFAPGVSVFKVAGKVFALSRLNAVPLEVSVKCDPVLAEDLRASYEAIRPGYHLNKRHWITVTLGGDAGDALVRDLIEDSHDLVRPRPRRSRRRS